MRIDADVFDTHGNLSARIRDNEFNVIPGQHSYRERPDRSTLVVYDKQGKEMLRVRYLNPAAAQIRGIFACADMPPVTISDTGIKPASGKTPNDAASG
jgi:hypothetical protein